MRPPPVSALLLAGHDGCNQTSNASPLRVSITIVLPDGVLPPPSSFFAWWHAVCHRGVWTENASEREASAQQQILHRPSQCIPRPCLWSVWETAAVGCCMRCLRALACDSQPPSFALPRGSECSISMELSFRQLLGLGCEVIAGLAFSPCFPVRALLFFIAAGLGELLMRASPGILYSPWLTDFLYMLLSFN